MKSFDRFLQAKSKPEWSLYYINYKYLKELVMDMRKGILSGKVSKKDAEHKFTTAIEVEMTKVNNFFLLVQKDILAKLQSLKMYLNKTESINKARAEALDEHIDQLGQNITDIYEYTLVNFTVFRKILKKHDRYTDMVASPWFLARCKEQPFYTSSDELGNLLVKYSQCCSKARALKGNAEVSKTVVEGGLQNFQRATTKYWVKQEDVMRVKAIIAKHLPVNIFTSKSARFQAEQTDSAYISSCYYDNPATMELYEGRVRKSQGAIALRFREYEAGKEIFVERKTHHESWISDASSIKERFDLDPSDVFDFIRGTYKTEDFIKRLKEQKKNDAAIKAAVQLFEEIQWVTIHDKLVPTMTTAYYRTAFQIAGDARVRISIDSNLQMIRERLQLCNDGKWRKDSMQIAEDDVHDFPYAVLEVKLQTHEGVEPPEWVTELVNGPYVREAHKFSKFIHGCAMLIPDLVPCWPVWIREFTGDEADSSDRLYAPDGHRDVFSENSYFHESNEIEMDVFEGEQAIEESMSLSYNQSSSCLTKIREFWDFDKRFPREKEVKMNRLKIEPKTYFANERVFLKWVSFSLVIQGVGLSMITTTETGEWAPRLLGAFMVAVSTGGMFYSFYNFRWRAAHIRNRSEGRFDDVLGPLILFGIMSICVLLNTIFVISRKIQDPAEFQTDVDYY